MTKTTTRKRKQPGWETDDESPFILVLTDDEDESKSMSVSDFNSSEDGKRSPTKTVGSSSFDREILLGEQEEDDLQFPSPAKDSPIAKVTRKSRSCQNHDCN